MSSGIQLFTDLIRDERGNYYTAVQQEENRLFLVNAFVEVTYNIVYRTDEEFRARYQSYEGGLLGKIPMDVLRHDIVFAAMNKGEGKLYDLSEISAQYDVCFIDTIEYYRHPSQVRTTD
ncbi:hypothetical protein Q5741_04240 [Paenibacillus sp. JX-17]|uniref:Uncharacterized protein n=1 Tax=Paenibacillus lacisoli TaxID=3064525 RepID=A0ABT9C9R4_9BACL|nr:hypothetical protein [Paenibacillus sp. JX-17]MDO7905620.1 hypothetical protein [Paenibacillus sp. JX-17]